MDKPKHKPETGHCFLVLAGCHQSWELHYSEIAAREGNGEVNVELQEVEDAFHGRGQVVAECPNGEFAAALIDLFHAAYPEARHNRILVLESQGLPPYKLALAHLEIKSARGNSKKCVEPGRNISTYEFVGWCADRLHELAEQLHESMHVRQQSGGARCSTGRMTNDEANVRLRKVLNQPEIQANIRLGRMPTQRELAKEVGCSHGLIAKLPAYQAVKQKADGLRKPAAKNAVSLPDVADGERDEELKQLVRDQKRDDSQKQFKKA